MSHYQFIDLQDGRFAIGLPLQENYMLLLDVREFETHRPCTDAIGTITSISDGMLYTTLGPFESVIAEQAAKTWQQMEVVESVPFANEINKWFLDTKGCWYLLRTKTEQYAVGTYTNTGKPIPLYYLEQPNNLYDFACYVMNKDAS